VISKSKGLEEFLELVKNSGGGIEEKTKRNQVFYKGQLKSSEVTTSF